MTFDEYIFEVKWRDASVTKEVIKARTLKEAVTKFKDKYGWYNDAKYSSYKIINKEYDLRNRSFYSGE